MKKIFAIFLAFIIFFPFVTLANVGVGVGTGKIVVDNDLHPGSVNTLPGLVVLNTGDEASEYGVGIQFHESQKEMRPEEEWFSFEPQTFYLEPGQTKLVGINLVLPVKDVKPGEYFAFLQAYPIKKETTAGATVNVAAAAKLYFTVEPSNIFQGIYYRVLSIYQNNTPWSHVVLVVILLAIIISIFRRVFNFQINIGRK